MTTTTAMNWLENVMQVINVKMVNVKLGHTELLYSVCQERVEQRKKYLSPRRDSNT